MATPALRYVSDAELPGPAAPPHDLPPANEPPAAGAARTAHAAVDDVALLVRQRRVRFDLDREYVDGTSGHSAAGWTVRFFALHDKGAHPVPACPCCRRLALELRRIAVAVLCDASLEADVEIGTVTAALYESTSVANRDEVALAVRVWPRGRAAPRPGGDDGQSGALRRHLRRFGLAEA